MNYKTLNACITGKLKMQNLTEEEITYLRQNSVLYFSAKNLIQDEQLKEDVFKRAEPLASKYKRTISLLHKISKDSSIPFLLFKTFKYIDEVVDGDIDLIVHRTDLAKLKDALTHKGFKCKFETTKKLECTKTGYSKVEPRTDITHHGYQLLPSELFWQFAEKAQYSDLNIQKTTREIDSLAIILNFLYGPKYLKLYDYLLIINSDWMRIKDIATQNNLVYEIKLIESLILNPLILSRKFPIFLPNSNYLTFWFKRIFTNKNISIKASLKHIAFFFLIKYRYLLTSKLYFDNSWGNDA